MVTTELSARGRAVRTSVTLVVGALLTVGTLWGQDDHFPFGPFRMYATSSTTSGPISVPALEARVGGGPWVPVALTPRSVGMNRAEVEGQLPRLQDDPALLGKLAAARARLHPDEPRFTQVRLVRRSTVVHDRVPTGEVVTVVLAQWPR